MSFNELLINL